MSRPSQNSGLPCMALASEEVRRMERSEIREKHGGGLPRFYFLKNKLKHIMDSQ